MNLHLLTDRELILYADNVCNDLTTIPLETELLRRFAEAQPVLEVLRQYGSHNAASLVDDFDYLNVLDSYMPKRDVIELLKAMYNASAELDGLNPLELFHHLMEKQK